MRLKLSISPCPNDTFMFEALIRGGVDTEGLEFDVVFADIEELNDRVLAGDSEISKISYAILPEIISSYNVLDAGSALGRGNGPLVVAGKYADLQNDEISLAVPGLHTTANLLMSSLFPNITDKTPVLFSNIADQVAMGKFDAGVLIHEGRFTYSGKDLVLLCDLGAEWEKRSRLPLPLGGIAVSKKLPEDVQSKVNRVLRRSVEYAFENPEVSEEFVRIHAQEMDPGVIESHIKLFVNEYSVSLGAEGRNAIRSLTGLAEEIIFVS